MTICEPATTREPEAASVGGRPCLALLTALLGFFLVTVDAVIVNVAFPRIRTELGGGIQGLHWVVDSQPG